MRYLVVGLGNIGQRRKELLGPRCVATADPYAAGADFRHPKSCPSDRYDAAVLAVPTDVKLELLEFLLGQGKHVLLEKPLLFPDRATAERFDALAKQSGATWYTSYNHRFEPLVIRLKQYLDEQAIGRHYYGRMFYGNGTVANVAGSWRDVGLGVIEDLGSHLLDWSGFLLGLEHTQVTAPFIYAHESSAPDHAILTVGDGAVTLEMSYVCWRNFASIELFGERGSLHMYGLPKWGETELIYRQRVLPSGRPHETRHTVPAGVDVTWQADLDYFESLCGTGRNTMENDWWISRALQSVVLP